MRENHSKENVQSTRNNTSAFLELLFVELIQVVGVWTDQVGGLFTLHVLR